MLVPYRGPVAATVQDILGGIRSTCTYVGASKVRGVVGGCVVGWRREGGPRSIVDRRLSEVCLSLTPASCFYIPKKTQLKELSKRTTFIRVTQQLNPVRPPFPKPLVAVCSNACDGWIERKKLTDTSPIHQPTMHRCSAPTSAPRA